MKPSSLKMVSYRQRLLAGADKRPKPREIAFGPVRHRVGHGDSQREEKINLAVGQVAPVHRVRVVTATAGSAGICSRMTRFIIAVHSSLFLFKTFHNSEGG